VNWTHGNTLGRVIAPVGVAYDSDLKKVKKVLLACARMHPDILRTPKPVVLLMEFSENRVSLELRCIIPNVMNRLRIKSELMFMIFNAFKKNKIRIPLPQRILQSQSYMDHVYAQEAKPFTQQELDEWRYFETSKRLKKKKMPVKKKKGTPK
jgi:small-conductance mechanosensitive channel